MKTATTKGKENIKIEHVKRTLNVKKSNLQFTHFLDETTMIARETNLSAGKNVNFEKKAGKNAKAICNLPLPCDHISLPYFKHM